MRTPIPEKLLRVAGEIAERGSVNLTKLTVLKKWFERPHRLTAFAILVAKRASGRKGKTTGKAADLFRAARSLLAGLPDVHPAVDRCEAAHLYERLQAFQNEYTHQQWGAVRIIRNRNLFLVEEGLRIYLWHADSPREGYRLAATYCENYDPRYGNSLNGPSYTKVHEIIRFMFTVEALEAV